LVLAGVVFAGTFAPVFFDALGLEKISVGPPWFKIVFTPFAIPLLMLVVAGPLLNWRRDELNRLWPRLRWPAGLAAAALLVSGALAGVGHVFTVGGMALGVWLVAGAVLILARRWRLGQVSAPELQRLMRATPLAVWGLVLAHAGLGFTTLGVTAMNSWQTNKVLTMVPGQSVSLAGQTITLDTIQSAPGPNFEATQARFDVASRFGRRALVSERRVFPVSQTHTTVAAIGVGLFGNTYISIGDPNPDGSLVVRMWDHPLVDWIWGGGLIMALGGVISLADRGLRVGAALRAPKPALAGAAASA
jgi:cytochrome c-type biogenesis protein CcmF